MTTTAPIIAAMSAIALNYAESAVPEWIHLLPAAVDGRIGTQDDRGPFLVADQQAVIDRTSARMAKIPVDENHSIHKAGSKGHPSPAVGWILELQSREDGIWGRVEWNDRGRALLEQKSYIGISPVFFHDKAKRVISISAASLVNTPNLRGLTALHSEDLEMTLSQTLAKLLGLDEDASDDDITAAVKKLKSSGGDTEAAQSQLDTIGTVFGLEAGTGVNEIVEAAQSSVSDAGDAKTQIQTLQSTVKDLSNTVTGLQETGAKGKSEAYFDAEMAKGRVGLNATTRDRYIAMHMKDPEGTEEVIEALPIIQPGALPMPVELNGAHVSLNSEQQQVARMLGQDPKDYAATLNEETNV